MNERMKASMISISSYGQAQCKARRFLKISKHSEPMG